MQYQITSNPQTTQQLAYIILKARELARECPEIDTTSVECLVPLRILKDGADPEQRLVYGEVLIPDIADAQEDVISAEEIEKTAHRFLAEYQQLGFMHRGVLEKGAATIVESYVAPVDFEINGHSVKKGSWVLVTKILDDNLWNLIKTGVLTGYSMGGLGMRVPESNDGSN